jgi:hypothetical protein
MERSAVLMLMLCASCGGGEPASMQPEPIVGTSGSGGTTVVGGAAGVGGAGAMSVGSASGAGGNTDVAQPAGAGAAGASASAAGMSGMPNPGGGGGSGEAGSTAGAGGATVVDVPCDPADETADATTVEFAAPGQGQPTTTPTGPYEPVMESDPGIATHTVVRPEPLGAIKHPILAWGQGGCRKSGNEGQNTNLFKEFASHGFLIIADGPARSGGPTMPGTGGEPLLFALEWARKENERPCSKYYHKLNVDKVAVSGQSCGGIMAMEAATDPKVTTGFLYNSGLFLRDQSIYSALHTPMAIFDGGPDDIAYANGLADFNAIDNVPILFANPTSCSANAHLCTFFEPSAGEYGRAGVAWMRWHLLDDQGATGKGMFVGDNCGLCDGGKWDVMWKMEPM